MQRNLCKRNMCQLIKSYQIVSVIIIHQLLYRYILIETI